MSCVWENEEGFCTHKSWPSYKQKETGGCVAIGRDYDECECYRPAHLCDCGADIGIGDECTCHEAFDEDELDNV